MKPIGVVGSINLDLVTRVKDLPKLGETISGEGFNVLFGGKGANEAVACSRLGHKSMMFGAVGTGQFSDMAILNLKKNKVDTKNVIQIKDESVGIAFITLANKNNSIIVNPNANALINDSHFEKMKKDILKCGIIGAQLEIPAEIVKKLSVFTKANGIKLVFNPSPMVKYSPEIFKNADYVIVNEIEITQLSGYNPKTPFSLLEKYPNKLILTKGKEGPFLHNGKKIVNYPSVNTTPVDTTGAGDTFLGAFMVKINEGQTPEEACIYANLAAGMKCTKLGAQTGMPTAAEVEQYAKQKA